MSGEPYARIVRTFWTDPEIKGLSRDLKTLALYFDTSPHGNMIGVYHCPLEYAAKESGVALEEVRAAVNGPLSRFLSYDHETEEVFVHGGAKHCIGDELNIGEKGPDHRIKNVENLVKTIHSPRLRRLFLERYAKAYHLSLKPEQPPPAIEGPSKALSSPSEAKAVAVAVSGAEHNNSHVSSKHAAGAAVEKSHTMSTTLGIVVEKLYFGTRPTEAEMKINGSVLKKLHEHGRSWDFLARVVEGLALRRNRGELKSVKPTDPISCKWLTDKDQDLNQLVVSEDGYYKHGPSPPGRSGEMELAGAVADRVMGRV